MVSSAPEAPYELPDDDAAIHKARQTLTEMTLDGLPEHTARSLSVRVYGPDQELIAELRVDYSAEIFRHPFGSASSP